MNFFRHGARAIISPVPLTSRPCRHYPSYLRPTPRSSLYSTSYQLNPPKTARTRKSQDSSSSPSWAHRAKKLAETPTNWARPSEIPFQSKVANLVNFIGHIKAPVKFQSLSNGKACAATLISQEYGPHESCSIPLFFEGDLAHVVSCHVKKNDCVYVSGKLSKDPMPFVVHEGHGNLHLVVENLNFVEGFDNKVKKEEVVEDKLPELADIHVDGETVWAESDDNIVAFPSPSPSIDDNVKHSGNINVSGTKGALDKKDGVPPWESWRDLVRNPKQWVDYREKKSKGTLSSRFPDFKHVENGTSLWVSGAPEWVLVGLQNLEFGAATYTKKAFVKDKKEEVWKSLVENPSQWWDNRVDKKNQKAPDFKHKETGEVLWLNSSPDWVASKLPPLRTSQNVGAV